jgi:signal transduction histidine kinase
MAEITARMDPEDPVETDLLEFLKNQLPTLNQLAPKSIRIEVLPHGQSFAVPLNRSERTWLEIVVFNLVHNAIRFSPPGGAIVICCGTNATGGYLSVNDQGPGVPSESREKIFGLHYHTDVKGWPKGHGMGLYEVRRLLNQLDWRIAEENLLPHGASFKIQIPINWRKNHDKSKGTIGRR